MWEYTHYDELYHHGVKGMRWGVRKTRKWATSKNQPSSAKSSFLAGVYAATGNERVGKALDKSNDRDAENWKRAKQSYKEQKDTTTKSKMSKGKKATIASLATVGTLAVAGAAVKAYRNRGRSIVNNSLVKVSNTSTIPIDFSKITVTAITRVPIGD